MAIALGSLLKYGKDRSNLKLKEINLDDNGLKDESFAHILDAISNQTDLQVINYNNNGLGLKSVAVLASLLQRKPPDNLKELVSSDFLSSLINNITTYTSNYQLSNDQMNIINQGLTTVIGNNF